MALELPYMGQPWADVLLEDDSRALIDIRHVMPLGHVPVLPDGYSKQGDAARNEIFVWRKEDVKEACWRPADLWLGDEREKWGYAISAIDDYCL